MKLPLLFFLSVAAALLATNNLLGATTDIATRVTFSASGLTTNDARVVAVPRINATIQDITVGNVRYREYAPGNTSYSGFLILERPYPADRTWKDWFDAAANGQVTRKDIVVTYSGNAPLQTQGWADCVPAGYGIVAGRGGATTERLKITVGRLVAP